MGQKLYREEDINNIGKAIQEATGDHTTQYLVSEMAAAISSIHGVSEKDVNFYDYDGKILYSYASAEIADLDELPALPDHTEEGLTNEGWNWSLADLKSMVDPFVDVGCTYIPTDGHTRFYMNIWMPCTLPFTVYASAANTCYIDWGDGSERTVIDKTSESYTPYTHEYTTAGKYVIELIPSENDYIFLGALQHTNVDANEIRNSSYKTMVNKIFLGKNIKMNSGCLSPYSSLEILSLNKTVQIMGASICGYGTNDSVSTGYNMKMLIIPKDFTINGWQDFATLYAQKVSLCSVLRTTNGKSATFLRFTNIKRCIDTMTSECTRDSAYGGYGFDSNLMTERYDSFFKRDMNYCGQKAKYALRHIYIHKSVSKPYYSASNFTSNTIVHVPRIFYDDMMLVSDWNTTFQGEVVPYDTDWQNNYERLIHIAELISNTRIDKWGQVSENANWCSTDYIPVSNGETIYVNSPHYECTYNVYNSNQERVAGGEINGLTWICDTDGAGGGSVIELPSTAAYVRFSGSLTDKRIYNLEAWRKLS